ncbi:MAG: methyltransferase [Candidatus Aminicenantes bacterium]|nr:methyltransferase [Candidatus Aminicenantes bacterium]NIM77550.1 methyltransferase [Candidatus Aminicenantes bacterium]NIN16871.1 methyltransferase [Candidatus Aminicenantes bacterium]NIN40759.1 methyltransferase [Candidatus Aminicenantes bacterium]NIN83568.1 methyltransferase [Candidatus Aminicenantes bacterium]
MSFKIGKQFEVFRSNETIEDGERIAIILGSGRAFGSGEHETTFSCLEELENIPIIPDAKVLDLGCGTGILSIAAARMGARHVIAVDPDANAIKATVKNIKLNKVEKKIVPLEGELEIVDDDDFDVIMSNLYGDILLKLVNDISTRLEPGGYLLLSGILYEDTYDLKTAFIKRGFDLLKARYLEEYTTLLFRKKNRQ